MKLLLNREYDNGRDTIGKLYFRDSFGIIKYIYILEDEYRVEKKPGDTRIPAGFYDVKIKKEGRIYSQYLKFNRQEISKFTEKYGVLEIVNVPGFDGIVFHIGNSEKDTMGCPLTGNMVNNNSRESGFISGSIDAYIFLIKAVEYHLDMQEGIRIEVTNFDRELEKLI